MIINDAKFVAVLTLLLFDLVALLLSFDMDVLLSSRHLSIYVYPSCLDGGLLKYRRYAFELILHEAGRLIDHGVALEDRILLGRVVSEADVPDPDVF